MAGTIISGVIFCIVAMIMLGIGVPYLGELIELAIEKRNKSVSLMLKNAIKHNKNVLKKIRDISKTASSSIEEFRTYMSNDEVKEEIMREFRFYEENDTVYFNSGIFSKEKYWGICSNIIRVSIKSKNERINTQIKEVNEYYEKIANYTYSEEG